MLINRTAQSFIGAASVASVTFVLSYLLLKIAGEVPFAVYSTFILLQGLFFGVTNAVICTPLAKATHGNLTDFEMVEIDFLKYGILICFVLACGTFATLFFINSSLLTNALLSTSMFLGLFRWIQRSIYNNRELQHKVFRSDVTYFASSFILLVPIYLTEYGFDLLYVACISVFSMTAALLPFGSFQLKGKSGPCIKSGYFIDSFKKQGRFALVGVSSTELSLSFHAYAIVFICGPSSFAPFAASYMYFRPLTLFVSNYFMMKRGRVVKNFLHSGIEGIKNELTCIKKNVGAIFLINAVVVIFFYLFFPFILWGDESSFTSFSFVLLVCVSIFAVRSCRLYLSFAFQISDKFAELSRLSLLNLIFLVFTVSIFLFCFEPMYTACALLIAEVFGLILYVINIKKSGVII